MKISKSLQSTIKLLKKTFISEDVIFFEFKAQNADCLAVYIDSITDRDFLGKFIVKPLEETDANLSIDKIKEKLFTATVKVITDLQDATEKLNAGHTLVFIDGHDEILVADIKKYETRSVAEPPTSPVVRGPREGFTESLKTNVSLLRRRLKTNDLTLKMIEVGKYTKTSIAVCYISSIADKDLADKIYDRISRINIDGIPDSSYISAFIADKSRSVFKQVGLTEKPDVLTAKLLEGRIGVIVDGSPMVLTMPYMIIEDFQSPEDYYITPYRANGGRILRLISISIAVLLPALFVAAQLFHLQLIPLNFLLTIVNSIKGIPLSPSYEMFFTLLIFEILNEASVRMPKYVGMAVSVVGALVLGDTAVRAGIVSTPTIMIMALSGICLYTVPDLVETMSVVRLIYLIVAGSLGGYGILLLTAYIMIYLVSTASFGAPLTAPYAPIVKNDLKDGFTMSPVTEMNKRPKSFKSKGNFTRLKHKEKDDG